MHQLLDVHRRASIWFHTPTTLCNYVCMYVSISLSISLSLARARALSLVVSTSRAAGWCCQVLSLDTYSYSSCCSLYVRESTTTFYSHRPVKSPPDQVWRRAGGIRHQVVRNREGRGMGWDEGKNAKREGEPKAAEPLFPFLSSATLARPPLRAASLGLH